MATGSSTASTSKPQAGGGRTLVARSSVARFTRSLRCFRRLRPPPACPFESRPDRTSTATPTAPHPHPPRPPAHPHRPATAPRASPASSAGVYKRRPTPSCGRRRRVAPSARGTFRSLAVRGPAGRSPAHATASFSHKQLCRRRRFGTHSAARPFIKETASRRHRSPLNVASQCRRRR